MNPAQLLAHFDRISEAQDAVPRLRRFILDLAVRGRLVDQDPNDEPASEWLRRIGRARKHRRVIAEFVKADVESPLPEIPEGWHWTVIDQIAADDENSITDGPFGANLKTEHYVASPGFRVIRLQNIGNGAFREEHRSFIDATRFERLSKHHVSAGDLVVAGLVDPSVRCCELPADIGPAVVKADCYRLAVHPEVCSRFVLHFLNSPTAEEFASVHHHGMTLTRIGLGNFRRIPVPLPPLAEQRRIVAKVDELMALCDRLEAAQTERENRRNRVVAASLNRLNEPAADDGQPFRDHACFHLRHLPRLATRPEHIPQLRRTILNLAVRGRLVPQDPNDEPVAELLRRLQATKPRRMKGGDSGTEPPPSVPKARGFGGVPGSWGWCRVDDAFEVCGGIQKTPARTPKRNTCPYLGVGNVYRGRLDLSQIKEFELLDGELERYRLAKGDILVVEGNGSANEVGRCASWSGEINPCVHQNHIIRCRPIDPELTPYVLTYLNSPNGIDAMKALAVTSSGLYNLSVGKIRAISIPLPPLAEQHRIVAKVEELMALCDQLEAHFTVAQRESRRLLEAVLHQALSPVA